MEIQGGKFLTFLLGEEIYGLPIKKAREIIGIQEITHIPRTQRYIKGVINLRGKIIPIIDLRLKFGLEEKSYNERTCVIIIEVDSRDTKRQVGVIVDAVYEVINIQKNEIDESTEYDAPLQREFLLGFGKLKDRVVMILNIEEILNHEELFLIRKELGVASKN